MTMVANLLSSATFSKRHSSPLQPDIPLSQMGMTITLQDSVDEDDNSDKQRVHDHWPFLCYFLHVFLVSLHIVLLVISASNHPERRITVPFDNEVFTTGLIFVTQTLVLSATFSTSKKLTQIHDICGAWGGFGMALSSLWSQTKVTSSVLSIGLVTAYFACVSVLHVASSTIMQFQPFNDTLTRMVPAVATWPDPSVDLGSLDWMAVTTLVPFLESLYGNTTNGLANNTLYDVPTQSFVNATVNATTLNVQCGLLTNLSIGGTDGSTVNVSMSNLDPFSVRVPYPPLLNEIWFSPSIDLECSQPQSCANMILYLVSAAIEIDDSVNGVYLNGTYTPPGGTAQNFTTPIYFVACSLNATTHMATLDPSRNQFGSAAGEQPGDVAWSIFSPGGDTNLTFAISSAMVAANSLPLSPYCQPIMSYPQWAKITAFNAYVKSVLGMGLSSCNGTSLAQYTGTPSLLTRGQVESVVSQIATEFIWLAGELGNAGGGFNRQTEESHHGIHIAVEVEYQSFATRPAAVSAPGVLEIMWLGSRSRVLRDHLRDMQNPSVDNLRASSMFKTNFWTRSPAQVHINKKNSGHYAAVPLEDLPVGSHASSSRSLGSSEFASRDSLNTGDLYQRKLLHRPDTSRSRHWCYVLHIVLVALQVILLALLIRHPEHSVVIPFESSTMTISLSALLQAIYMLYSALLVVVTQRLALSRIVCERRKLTTVHDVSGAWTGIGAAVYILWQQRQLPSSIREITAVVTYLTSMLVLHIGSSSIMQWQAFNSTLLGVLPSDLALPGSAVAISKLGWAEIFPIARSIGQDTDVSTYGLSKRTLYDVPQVPTNVTFSEASVNATTLDVQCGLVPNLTFSYQSSEGEYLISFSLNGTDNGNFLENPIWKDVVYSITPNTQCAACPQTLFYMITTAIDVDESVRDSVAVNLNWTYTPSGVDNVPLINFAYG
ncbi:hypothetical protein OG21DRAFT_1326343 [Imleria badia]|nr:hypothetical protein OG21DRAFT_1326343 [Imleria badia]